MTNNNGGKLQNDAPEKNDGKEEKLDLPHINRTFAITVISLFAAFLVLPTLVWGALKAAATVNPAIMDALDYNIDESRNKAEFPDKFDPESFTAEVEAWYNDRVPFRSVLFTAQEKLTSAIETPYTGTVRPFLIKLFGEDRNIQQINPPPSVDIKDPFGNEGEDTDNSEHETLPDIIEDESDIGDPDCDHVLSDQEKAVREASCTEYGVAGYECTLCGYIGNKKYTAKKPHSYGSATIEPDAPECGEKYTETKVCTACSHVSEKTLTKHHTPGRNLGRVEPSYESYGYLLVRCKDCRGEYRAELKNKLYDTSYCPPIYHQSMVIEGRYKWLFYRGDSSERFYMATNLLSDIELENYKNKLTQLNELCREQGITLQISIWPNKEQVYSEYMPSTMVPQTEYKRVERLVDYITENTEVNMIYPIKELLEAKPYWETYFMYDTHWNNAGGYIGYKVMMESLGYELPELIDLPVRNLSLYDSDYHDIVYDNNTNLKFGVKADMIQYVTDSAKYYERDNYIVTYKPEIKLLKDAENNNPGTTQVTVSTSENDLNFVMVADSYRVMQLPFIERDFKNCFLTHRDKAKSLDPDVVEAVRNADVLVVAAVERYEPDILPTVNALIRILSE